MKLLDRMEMEIYSYEDWEEYNEHRKVMSEKGYYVMDFLPKGMNMAMQSVRYRKDPDE